VDQGERKKTAARKIIISQKKSQSGAAIFAAQKKCGGYDHSDFEVSLPNAP
jgi:hypothetical protein